jgi:serine protease AprX
VKNEVEKMRRLFNFLAIAILMSVLQISALAAVSVDNLLNQQINAAPLSLTPVVITFDHKPANADFLMLQSLGITGGIALKELPMVLTKINKTQFDALRRKSGIVSLYANHVFKPMNNQSRKFIGVENLLADQTVTALNNNLPITGKNVGIAYIDTGIDATHPDLKLGENVIQNVLFPTAEVPLNFPSGFVPPVGLENQPMTERSARALRRERARLRAVFTKALRRARSLSV